MGPRVAVVGVVMLAATMGLQRPYAELTPQDFATARHTHVCTVGTVTRIRQEADGDIHVRVEAGGHFIIAEAIPALRVPAVHRITVGQRVRACGIRRYDDAPGHEWYEIHPVERLEILDGKQH